MKHLCCVALLSGITLAGVLAEQAEAKSRTVPSRTSGRGTGSIMAPRSGERVDSTMRNRLRMEDPTRLQERTRENTETTSEQRSGAPSNFNISDRSFRQEVDGLDAVPTMRQEDRIELLSAYAEKSNNPVIRELITTRQELFAASSEQTPAGRRKISSMMDVVVRSACEACAIGATNDLARARDLARTREGSEWSMFELSLKESGKLQEVRRRCNEFM